MLSRRSRLGSRPQRCDKLRDRRPVGRITARVGEQNGAACVHHEVSAELVSIDRRPTETPATQKQRDVGPDRAWAVDGPARAYLQVEGLAGGMCRVVEKREGKIEFGRQLAQLLPWPEADSHDLRACRLDFRIPLPQLRQMLTARQSAGVTQENEQQRLATPPIEGDGVSCRVLQFDERDCVADSERPHSYGSLDTNAAPCTTS